MFTTGKSNSYTFTPIQMDLSVLATPVNASSNVTALLAQKNFTTPAVLAPWANAGSGETSTDALVRKALASKTLFDKSSSSLSDAKGNKDLDSLFKMYQALGTLTAIAEKGASKTISSSYRNQLNDRLQQGLAEIQSYLATADTDQVQMLFGKKQSQFETVTIPKTQTKYEGLGMVAETASGTIKGLDGTESFTINLKTQTRSQDFTIDLSQIEGNVSINSVVNLINRTISSVVMTDADGNPTLNSKGQPYPLYDTRAEAYQDKDGKWGIRFNGSSVETISLGDPAVSSSLYVVTGTQKGSAAAIGGLTRLDDATGAIKPSYNNSTVVAGIDTDGTKLAEALAPAKDAKTKATDSTEETDEAAQKVDHTVYAQTAARDTAIDSQGFIYVVGSTTGDVGTQKGDGQNGLFLTKYAPDGSVVYSRLVAEGETEGYSLAIDKDDNVVIAGSTTAKLGTRQTDVFSGQDSFVSRYAADGTHQFTVQLDGVAVDAATAVTTDDNGDIYIAGTTQGRIASGQTALGSTDVFVAKIDGGPRVVENIPSRILSITQFGTSGKDTVAGIAIGPDGTLLVAGTENGEAVVRKLDSANLGNQLGQVNLGTATLSGIAVDETTGTIAVVGSTNTATLNAGPATGSHQGNADGFLARLDGALVAQGHTFLGSSGTDKISDVIASNGEFYVTGTTTGVMAGTGKKGSTDAFVSRLDAASGSVEQTTQFGTLETATSGVSLALNPQGHSSTLEKLGLRSGVLNPQQSSDLFSNTGLKVGDHFSMSVGNTTRKITIQEGETMDRLAKRIRTMFSNDLNVTVSNSSAGTKLQFKAKDGKEVTFSAGAAGEDALSKLGLEPGKLYDSQVLYGVGGEDPKAKDKASAYKPGGSFALDLDFSLLLKDSASAEYVKNALSSAVETVKRAYRSLYYDETKAAMASGAAGAGGSVSPYWTNKIANYQDALARLTGGS
ncbi:MAG TPA: hypothetical protein VIG90_12020 [Pedomonas sp.]|uniref:hypothetical protein n=1 Tax=Pedomonas sp. TaxID=2976421 RepID=UPI002F41A174